MKRFVRLNRPMGWVWLFLAVAGMGGLTIWRASAAAPQTIDLNQFTMTYDETFATLDVSPHGPGTQWIAHTPWNGDFGDAVFDNPGPGGPFSVSPAGLTITARQDGQGKWHSGLLSSLGGGRGFGQRYGYFEIMTKLPDGSGVWPAFWLVGNDPSQPAPEIDVFETYGRFKKSFRITEHLWVKNKDSLNLSRAIRVPAGSLSSQYNRFGVLIEPDRTTFYLNRVAVWSTDTQPEFKQKFYMLVDLALGGGWPIEGLASPQTMEVQYIRAYQMKVPPPGSDGG